MSDNYAAIVATIRTYPFEGMDNVQLGESLGYQVVIGKDVQTGDVGLLFPPDGQLSQEFCDAHNLIRKIDPETGKNVGGYFGDNRRIRAQPFRGEKSEAFWMPISCLDFAGGAVSRMASDSAVLNIVTECHGVPICNKWINPQTRSFSGQQRQNEQVAQNPWFRKHVDTEQLRHVTARDFPAGSLIWVTEKMHGTSHREGCVPEARNGMLGRLLKLVGIIPQPTWVRVSGSRNITLRSATDSYYQSDFRQRATSAWRDSLRPGEVIYGEIVGWATHNKPIMATHDPAAAKLTKVYGKEPMVYSYGLAQGECEFYAYRIVQHAPDGTPVELGHQQVIARCHQLGIKSVPVVAYAHQYYHGPEYEPDETPAEYYRDFTDGNEWTTHVSEGIVVRVERPDGKVKFYKQKGYEFCVMEGIATETQIDYEETQ